MPVERLRPADAADYRALMLDAYARRPDAYTSTVAEREALPLDCLAGGDLPAEMVLGVRREGRLCGVVFAKYRKMIGHLGTVAACASRVPATPAWGLAY